MMLPQGELKLTEAKCIGDKAAFCRYEDRLHPSYDTPVGNPNETSRHRWFVQRISLGGHDDRPKYIILYSAKQVG